MDVLIIDFGLYSGTVGGGQTVYRKLVEANPAIRFHYPSYRAEVESPPGNAFPIQIFSHFVDDPTFDVAASLGDRHFDVVDIPDFNYKGMQLVEAFRHLGGSVDTVALAMHGRLSRSFRHLWEPKSPDLLEAIIGDEQLLFHYADVRYGISQAYIDEMTAFEERPAHYMDPIGLYGLSALRPVDAPGDGLPMLLFVGRTERGKGPDIFVDIVSNIPPGLYSEAVIVGPHGEKVAPAMLGDMAFRRGMNLRFAGSLSHQDVLALYRQRCVVVMPGRQETLNLVALEALLSGCPTAIAPHLGVARALDEIFPGIPHLRIPIEEPVVAGQLIASLLQDYDERRRQLVDWVNKAKPAVRGKTLSEIYASPSSCDPAARTQAAGATRWHLDQAVRVATRVPVRGLDTDDVAVAVPEVLGPANPPLQRRKTTEDVIGLFRRWSGDVSAWLEVYKQLAATPDLSPEIADLKWQFLTLHHPRMSLDRVRRFRELARIEVLRGRPLIATAYELRVMRWLGEDHFKALPWVKEALVGAGFNQEAQVAELMFGEGRPHDRDKAIFEYLRGRTSTMMALPPPEFERAFDGRKGKGYRVAAVVSLYDAAEKLPRFLRALTSQGLFKAGRMEIILVDSGSPRDEGAVVQAVLGEQPEHLLYVRTRNRETIQCAWNRGIALARAPYLLFIGADEEMRPDALELLVDELDKNDAVDWVQASAVALEVDPRGVYSGDANLFDRKWVDGDALYLDTAFVGHVVGVYRKALHDRVGLYDPTFRAAGDTEFKIRALPYMRVRSLPLVLGRYVNYPEIRTSANCFAEIEDLRAWYLHRTPAGMRYAFGERHPRDIGGLLASTLQHQKSYLGHVSSDADLAILAADLLAEKDPSSPMLQYREGSLALQRLWRRADLLLGDWSIGEAQGISPEAMEKEVLAIGAAVNQIARHHGRLRGLGVAEDYHFFNDNRCEQHSWIWK